MAHQVSFELPRRTLGREDVIFEVREDGELLGELKVSKGAIVWRPGWGKLSYRLSWDRFDRLMSEQGRRGPYS